jgi:hypothetical protein
MNGWEEDVDLLPATTEDETGPGWGEAPRDIDDDQWLRDERPPHWD